MAHLEDSINELWYSIIEDMNIDVFNHAIIFKTKGFDSGITTRFELKFEEVSAFFFVENTGKQRFNLLPLEERDFTEITSVWHYPKGVGKISIDAPSEAWADQYFSNANFSVELWSSFLFIEAKRVVINGEIFEVNYPLE